jgi:polyisoprenoid-binding protein YceI
MKKFNYPLLFVSILIVFATSSATTKYSRNPTITIADVAYDVDLRNSKINWNIKTSRGANNGELRIKSGFVTEDNGVVKKAEILMDMTAIMIRSIPPGIVNMKAVTILNTESFFDVAKFPTSLMEITRTIQKTSNTFEVIGFLTIKGRRQPIRFTMTGGFNYGHFEGKAKNIVVNRNLYDIRYTTSGDVSEKEFEGRVEDAIDDSFTIDVFIVADKKASE